MRSGPPSAPRWRRPTIPRSRRSCARSATWPHPPATAGARSTRKMRSNPGALRGRDLADARGEHAAAAERLRSLVGREPAQSRFPPGRWPPRCAPRAGPRRRPGAAAPGDDRAFDPLAWHERSSPSTPPASSRRRCARSGARSRSIPRCRSRTTTWVAARARGGREAEALQEFTRATTLDPNNAAAWTNRANALRAVGQSRRSGRGLPRPRVVSPRGSRTAQRPRCARVEAGDLDRAVALFEEALAIDPRYHEARLNLAVAEVRRGHPAAARAAAAGAPPGAAGSRDGGQGVGVPPRPRRITDFCQASLGNPPTHWILNPIVCSECRLSV